MTNNTPTPRPEAVDLDQFEGMTPGPWKWQGEDYRGDWGWMMLVDAKGYGLIIGQGNDGSVAPGLQAGLPARADMCITGLVAKGKPRYNAVHVFKPSNARAIVALPALIADLRATRGAEAKAVEERDKLAEIIKRMTQAYDKAINSERQEDKVMYSAVLGGAFISANAMLAKMEATG